MNPFYINDTDMTIEYKNIKYGLTFVELNADDFEKLCLCNLDIESIDKNNLVLIKIDTRILNYSNAIKTVNHNILELFNHNKYELCETENIVLLFNFTFKHYEKLNKLVTNYTSLKEFIELFDICYYYHGIYFGNYNYNLLNIIKNIDSIDYWKNNIIDVENNDFFNKKCFVQHTPTNIINNTNKITDKPQKTDYDSISTSESTKNNLYHKLINYFVINPDYSCDEQLINIIKLLYKIENSTLLYYVINYILLSPAYCHIILKSVEMLNILNNLTKYILAFNYTMAYAWRTLYFEEILIDNITLNDRCVMTLDTASCLPVFPVMLNNIYDNPYIVFCVAKKYINYNNTLSYPMTLEHKYGICNLEEFKRRVNLFICSSNNYNILENIDFNKLNFAIVGSIIPACARLNEHLIDKTIINNDEAFIKFIETYYNDSDVDILSRQENVYEFMDDTYEFIQIIQTNIRKYTQNNAECKVICDKHVTINVTTLFIKNNLEKINVHCNKLIEQYYNQILNISEEQFVDLATLKAYITDILKHIDVHKIVNYDKLDVMTLYCDYINEVLQYINIIKSQSSLTETEILNNTDIHIIKEYIYKLYLEHMEINLKISDSPIYKYYNDIADINNVNILAYDDTTYEYNVFMSFKLRVSFEGLKTFEFFRMKNVDMTHNYLNGIKNFHLPCVRGYYDGLQCYLLPSCISALLTGINTDNKCYVQKIDPIAIIEKYRHRGFGTILNQKELEYYNSSTTKKHKLGVIHLKSLLHLPLAGATHPTEAFSLPFGALPTTHTVGGFPPPSQVQHSLHTTHMPTTYITIPYHKLQFYKKLTNNESFKLLPNDIKVSTIDSDTGTLLNCKLWILDMIYDNL